MRKPIRAAGVGIALGIAALLPFPASAESGSYSIPSLRASEIYLSNPTAGEVIFYLETERTNRTEFRLKPGESATFTGAEGDTWFNIQMFSAGGERKYGVNVGDRFYFVWDGQTLDIRKL